MGKEEEEDAGGGRQVYEERENFFDNDETGFSSSENEDSPFKPSRNDEQSDSSRHLCSSQKVKKKKRPRTPVEGRKCQFCGKRFQSRKNYDEHVDGKCPLRGPGQEAKPFQQTTTHSDFPKGGRHCQVCLQFIYKEITYKNHIAAHAENIGFNDIVDCPGCGMSMSKLE